MSDGSCEHAMVPAGVEDDEPWMELVPEYGGEA
jgi:hypothetical protein